jgi:methionyl-tRNA formyltransferase
MKIGLYLMGNKGLDCLKAVLILCEKNSDFEISFVVAAKDTNVKNDYFVDIQNLCNEKYVLFSERGKNQISNSADIIFAISWRWLIYEELQKLIVFHDSLLPKLRGFNPLVTSLIEGYSEIGVTAIRADKEFDKGNILGQEKIAINYPIKIEVAIEMVGKLYAELIVKVLLSIQNGTLNEKEQNENEATYSLWRDEDDYSIDWNQSSEKIVRTIHALGFPYKGAKANYKNETIRIFDAIENNDINLINRTPGKILTIEDNCPVVVCGKGLVKIINAINEHNNSNVLFDKLRTRL